MRLGDLDLNSTVEDGANPIDVEVNMTIVHPKFDRKGLQNDIALVRLQTPVQYTGE